MHIVAPPPRRAVEPRAAPTFSVVIRAYQAAGTVGEAVASVLSQTRPAHEIIVVDDGSTDDLDGALAEFADRITLVRKQNGGGASALNTGAAVAAGEFLAILDADDVYGPRRLEVLADLAASRPDLDIVTTDSSIVLEGRVVGRFHVENPFASVDQRGAILRSCFVGGWPAVRISRVLAVGGWDETVRIAHDWDCWIRLILDGALAGAVSEPHHEYRLRSDSLTAERANALWERVRILEKTTRNPALRKGERPALSRSLRHHRTRAVLAEAEAVLARGERRPAWLLRQAASPRLAVRTRILLALTAAAPSFGQRWIQRGSGSPDQRFPTVGS